MSVVCIGGRSGTTARRGAARRALVRVEAEAADPCFLARFRRHGTFLLVRTSLPLLVGVLGLLALHVSCGGKELGVASSAGTGDDASGEPEGSGSSSDSGEDSPSTEDSSPSDGSLPDVALPDSPVVTTDAGEGDVASSCMAGPSSTSGSSDGACAISATETCGDTTYHADCKCPPGGSMAMGTCSCSQMSGSSGGGSSGMPYGGCASSCASPNAVWMACGFPIP
jgi:hypothetical protein